MTSIFDDFAAIGRLIGRDLEADLKAYAPHGRCDTCDGLLDYEPPFHGTFDQPPSAGGYWCSECQTWETL